MSISAQLEELRRSQLDLSLNNPHLDSRRAVSETIPIWPETADGVFARLKQGVSLGFCGIDAEATETLLHAHHDTEELERRIECLQKETEAFPSGTQALWLAVGMVHWLPLETNAPCGAPLLFLPLEWVESEGRARVRLAQGDPQPNHALLARLSADLGCSFPAWNAKTPTEYIAALHAVLLPTGWRVFTDALFLCVDARVVESVYADLDPRHWESAPGKGWAEALLSDAPLQPLPPVIEFESAAPVLALDARQCEALHCAQSGCVVVDGAAGTGKTQWAVALLAQIAAQGQTALVLLPDSDARGALLARMAHAGLGELCLDLTACMHAPRLFQQQLLRSWNASAMPPAQSQKLEAAEIARTHTKEWLDGLAAAMHQPIPPSGLTLAQLYGQQLDLEQQFPNLPPLSLPPAALADDGQLAWAIQQTAQLRELLRGQPAPNTHPLFGCQITQLSPEGLAELRQLLSTAAGQAAQAAQCLGNVSQLLGQQPASDAADVKAQLEYARLLMEAPKLDGIPLAQPGWQGALEVRKALRSASRFARDYKQARAPFQELFTEDAWNCDVTELFTSLKNYAGKKAPFAGHLRRLRDTYHTLVGSANIKEVDAMLASLQCIQACQKIEDEFMRNCGWIGPLYGEQWKGILSKWQELDDIAAWIHRALLLGHTPQAIGAQLGAYKGEAPLRDALEKEVEPARLAEQNARQSMAAAMHKLQMDPLAGLPIDRITLANLQALAQQWLGALDSLGVLVSFNALTAPLRNGPFAGLLPLAAEGFERIAQLPEQMMLARVQALVRFANSALSGEYALTSAQLGALSQEYGRHSEQSMLARRAEVLVECRNRVQALAGAKETIQNCAEGADWIAEHADLCAAIAPIWLVQTETMNKLFRPGKLRFDWVIVESAEQIDCTDGLRALMRGMHAALLGNRALGLPGNLMEGILRKSPSWTRFLRVYRASHPSLSGLTNLLYYGGQLELWPSVERRAESTGLKIVPSEGGLDLSTGAHTGEARLIAQTVMAHALRTPQLSLGVVALTHAQCAAIQWELDALRASTPRAEPFFSSTRPTFFIQSLEEVGNQRRDLLIVSLGGGSDGQGHIAVPMGILGSPDARDQARARVQFGRMLAIPRLRMSVYSELSAEELASIGAQPLDMLIMAAETTASPPEHPMQGDLLGNVHRWLTRFYRVQRLESREGELLAVIHPEQSNRYLIGLLDEGNPESSCEERERIRIEQLTRRGWKLERLSTAGWALSPARELEALMQTIQQLLGEAPKESPEKEAPEPPEAEKTGKGEAESLPEAAEPVPEPKLVAAAAAPTAPPWLI